MKKTKGAKKFQNIEEALDYLKHRYGKGSIFRLESDEEIDIPKISTGIKTVDDILGGGFPAGRVSEILGLESTGKTMLALHTIASAQQQGITCLFVDAEHALSMHYAKALGIDLKKLLVSQPEYGEQALEIVKDVVSTGAIGLIVVDSVAALAPKMEIDGEMSDSSIGLQARLMSKALRKLVGMIAKTNTTLIFINQLKMKIDPRAFVPTKAYTSPGGLALRYHASIRVKLELREKIRKGNVVVGARVNFTTIKNKIYPPYREADLYMLFYGDKYGFYEELPEELRNA